MAKRGFTYYSVDTDRYQDIRIKRLKKEFGCQGIAVYDYILCEIYRVRGCFLEWDESTAFDVAEYFGLKETLVKEIVRYCLAVGLFDRELLKCGSVLSSRSIQLRYVEMCGRTKRRPAIPQEYDLLDGENKNSEDSGENSDFPPKTPRKEKSAENALSEKTDKNSEFPLKNSEFSDDDSDKPPKTPIFFDKEKESKIKEEEEKEEESPAATTAAVCAKNVQYRPVRSGLQPIDPMIDALKERSMFTEYCMMSYHLTDQELCGYLDKFKSFLHATDEHEKTLKDCKNHFMNWLSLTLQRERKERESIGGVVLQGENGIRNNTSTICVQLWNQMADLCLAIYADTFGTGHPDTEIFRYVNDMNL